MTDLALPTSTLNLTFPKKMGPIDPNTATAKKTADPSAQNFGLTQAQFEAMLGALQKGDEALFERVFLGQFETVVARLKKTFHAPHADAYDSAMWALLRFREYLVGGKIAYGNLESYFQRIATNHFLKKQERNREFSDHGQLPLTLPDADDFLEKQFSQEEIDLLDQAWAMLCTRCKAILQGFYYDNLDHKTITALIGDTNEATTRQRKRRCIEELRGYFFKLAGI